ncbi:MAG: NAD(P)H-binding protein [Armatimonadetes bacterium]|nr:NAD(P)H-binding protein [Armatimonadota bacterium]
MAETSGRVVAITGGSGMLGGALCERFARADWQVRALVRRPEARAATEGVTAFRCDLPDSIDPAGLDGAEVLIHAAYQTRFTTLAEARRVDEDGTRAILALAEKSGVNRRVYISSLQARPDSRSYYGRSKHLTERWFDGERDLIVRPGLILSSRGGLFHRLQEAISKSPVVPLFGAGRQRCWVVHLEDACDAVERAVALDRRGLMTLAAPEAVTLAALFRKVASHPGRRPLFVPLPIGPGLLALRASEALGLRLAVSSENLRGLLTDPLPPDPADLAGLGVVLRGPDECLAALLGPGGQIG